MDVYDLSRAAIENMRPADLVSLFAPPASPIGEFTFHDCTCGVACFTGTPPWERHTAGDELLHVLAGETHLTLLKSGGPAHLTLGAGALVIVPQGVWHRNSAPESVTVLYMTPADGNEHSWEQLSHS